jgi:ATP-dependent Clp protease ATP-binding subunit ClpC
MFERFSTNARGVVIQAQEEARQLQHNYIGTEHILLGLFTAPTSIAAQALRQLGVTAPAVREAIEAEVGRGKEAPSGHIPFTKRAKKILELALREALQLKHNYIGTEHILLAVDREGEGLAAKILAQQVNELRNIRATVMDLLGAGPREHLAGESARRTTAAEEVVTAAQALAGGAPMGSHHLLEALIRAEGSLAAKVLSDLGIDPATVAAKVDELDTENTTDATPEETAARKMELRLVRAGAPPAETGGQGSETEGTLGENAGGAEGPDDVKAGRAKGPGGVRASGTEEPGGMKPGGTEGPDGAKAGHAEAPSGIKASETEGPSGVKAGHAEGPSGVKSGRAEGAGDEVHLVFRDQATIDLAKAVAELVDGPITGAGPVAGKFVPLWTATNELLMSILQSVREEPSQDAGDRGKAALLVRRVLHDRLRRRGRAAG